MVKQKELIGRDIEDIREIKRKLEEEVVFLEAKTSSLENSCRKILDRYLNLVGEQEKRFLMYRDMISEKTSKLFEMKSIIIGETNWLLQTFNNKIDEIGPKILGMKKDYTSAANLKDEISVIIDSLNAEKDRLTNINKKLREENDRLSKNNDELIKSIKYIEAREESVDRKEVAVLDLARETQEKYQQLLKKICQQEHQ